MATRTTTSPALLAGFRALLLCLSLGASAAPAVPADPPSATAPAQPDFGLDSHTAFVTRVNTAQSTDYRAVLALYDARRASHPDDVVSQVERCRFIEVFAYTEDVSIESAGDDLTACREQLKSGPHKEDVDVMLYDVESSWDDARTKEAKALIAKSGDWTRPQQARLYELLAERTQWKEKELSGAYAIQAVELDPGSSALLMAVNRLVQLGAKDKVRRIILAAPESTWDKVGRTQVAQVLLDLGDADLAQKLLAGAASGKRAPGENLILARALKARGNYPEASRWYKEAVEKNAYVTLDTRVEYFEFERDHGTKDAAVAAYEKLRAQGIQTDPFARYRLSLLLVHPGLPWHWRDTVGVLRLLLAILITCLVPLLVIVPVHYRGLALRASGRAPAGFTPAWSLRDAWYAFAVFILAGLAALYVFAMPYLEALLPNSGRSAVDPVTDLVLAKILLYSIVASFVLLLPLLRRRSIKSTLCGKWTIKRSIFTGIGLAVLLKILAALIGLGMRDASVLGSDTVRGIQGANEAYGLLGMLMLIAVLTPITEELVFRGVLLQAFRGQVSFLFATLVQATAFTLMHEEWQSMAFLFVFALVAAWLAKRSEGLLAPMVMHCVNNAAAGVAIVGITNVLNQ